MTRRDLRGGIGAWDPRVSGDASHGLGVAAPVGAPPPSLLAVTVRSLAPPEADAFRAFGRVALRATATGAAAGGKREGSFFLAPFRSTKNLHKNIIFHHIPITSLSHRNIKCSK